MCNLAGCSHNKNYISASSKSEESLSTESEDYSSLIASIDLNLTNESQEKVNHTESNEIQPQGELTIEDNTDNFSVHDIFISEIPILNKVPFMMADIEDIQANRPVLEKTASEKRGFDNYFIYYKDEGITYVTHFTGDFLAAVVLNKDGYSLNCGLKVGMAEAEILKLNLRFEKFAKEDLFDGHKSIGLVGSFLVDEKSPINTETFDTLYVYTNSIPEEEVANYDIWGTSCIGILALVKDGTISHIILNRPNAG